jgi:hypothetical protein
MMKLYRALYIENISCLSTSFKGHSKHLSDISHDWEMGQWTHTVKIMRM